jgi:hypothetical protein
MTLSDIQRLPPAEKDALLDDTQFTLDVVGCFEPTPFADLTNALLSMTRARWSEAMLSVVGVVPYVGDLAKLGKAPHYLKSVERAIQLARNNRSFAVMLQPVLTRLSGGLRSLPLHRLPLPVQQALKRMQKSISDYLPGGARAVSRLDQLTDDVLMRVFGSTRNVGVLPRKNVRTTVEFFDKHGVGGRDPAQWAELIKGIDLHAVEPVEILRFKPGDLVAEYVELSRPANRQIGQWMVRAQGAVSHRNLGLASAGRERKVFRVKQDVEVLKSKAAPAADHWTTQGSKPHTAVVTNGNGRAVKPAEQVGGGGDQYFLPEAWKFLESLP